MPRARIRRRLAAAVARRSVVYKLGRMTPSLTAPQIGHIETTPDDATTATGAIRIGDPTGNIVAAFRRGDNALATDLFLQSGGDLFAFTYGYDALGRVLDAMPNGFWRDHEAFLGAYFFYLAKLGRAGRAQAHLTDPDLTFERTVNSETYELLVAIHLGDPVEPAQLDQWLTIERRLPLSDPLREGLYYNSILVFLVRHGKLKEARIVAQRAISAYKDAKHLYLEHFIHLHLADFSIMEGRLREGRISLALAEQKLASSGQTYGNERNMIEIVQLTLDYEQGRFAHIPARAAALREALVSGDSWAEVFEQLARISVKSILFTAGRDVALAELDAFRAAYAQRHGGVSEVLVVLEAAVDRLDWRFGDVEVVVAALDHSKLQSPIAKALLADVVSETQAASATDPGSPRVCIVRKLEAAALEKGNARRRLVERAFWLAVKEGHVAPFLDHRDLFAGIGTKLAAASFARGHIQLARLAKKTVRLIEVSHWMPPELKARGVTQRQFRIATALQSGATNKEIARAFSIDEATVKYHLSKLFDTFGTRQRGELLEIMYKI